MPLYIYSKSQNWLQLAQRKRDLVARRSSLEKLNTHFTCHFAPVEVDRQQQLKIKLIPWLLGVEFNIIREKAWQVPQQ